jgi:SET domain-containing protein
MTRPSARPSPSEAKKPMIRVRRSGIHGSGVFATRLIPRGTRVIEYVGERMSYEEADRRYEHRPAHDAHALLFVVDDDTVVDAGVGGNKARYINHGCKPNCEAGVTRGRIWIRAIRNIQPREELFYDYRIGRDPDDPPDIDEIFACRCRATKCRGTMLIGRARWKRS